MVAILGMVCACAIHFWVIQMSPGQMSTLGNCNSGTWWPTWSLVPFVKGNCDCQWIAIQSLSGIGILVLM